MYHQGAILQIAVSILVLNNWREIEKNTPSPYERIETLKHLHEAGIHTSVAFRPILPFITPEEIEEIVELTHRYTYAYLTGPVYLTPALINYINNKGYKYTRDKKQVSWIPGNPSMDVVQSLHLEKLLTDYAQYYQVPVFKSNIDLVKAIGRKICQTLNSSEQKKIRLNCQLTFNFIRHFLQVVIRNLGVYLCSLNIGMPQPLTYYFHRDFIGQKNCGSAGMPCYVMGKGFLYPGEVSYYF